MILILVSTIKTRKTNNMTELLQVLVQVILLIFLQKKKNPKSFVSKWCPSSSIINKFIEDRTSIHPTNHNLKHISLSLFTLWSPVSPSSRQFLGQLRCPIVQPIRLQSRIGAELRNSSLLPRSIVTIGRFPQRQRPFNDPPTSHYRLFSVMCKHSPTITPRVESRHG